MNEHELETLARGLGTARADRVDVERIARGVVAGLRQAPAGWRILWLRPATLRIAAVLVLLLGAGLLWRARVPPAAPVHPDHYIYEDLNGLSSDELRDVLSTLDQTLQDASPLPADDDLNDLSPDQLRAVLRSIEG